MPPKPTRRKLSKPAQSKPDKSGKDSSQPTDKTVVNNPTSPELAAAEKLSTEFEKKTGLSAAKLKDIFTAPEDKETEKGKKISQLKELLRSRCVDLRQFSLRDWRSHAAVDTEYMSPFDQISPPLIGKILAKDPNLSVADLQKELARWGLGNVGLIQNIYNADGKTIKEQVIQRESFTTVKVPYMKAVCTARESRLFQERNNPVFLSYEPRRTGEAWMVMGEVITQLVDQMVTSYGWRETYRSANHQATKYAFAMMFPTRSWDSEFDFKDGKKYTKREGLSYNIPHPTRVGWDQTCRPGTLNSDSGCKWAGYWRLANWGNVDRNPAYYNKDKVSYSRTNWLSDYSAYFEYTYPCKMAMPTCGQMRKGKDREENADLYTSGDHDKAVFLTDLFCRLSPAQWGLSDYEPEVWIGFVLSGDGQVNYAEPYPFTPPLYLGTDADDGISNSVPSFALEALPWGFLIGNVLTDILESMRKNSIKVVFYDSKVITPDKIETMMAKAKGANNISWFDVDWRELARAGVNIEMFFKPFTFPQQNIMEKISTLNTIFNVAERALGLSAQDVSAIAAHIQTAEEIRTVSSNSDTRLELPSAMGDDFFDAWKRQALEAMMMYMDEEFAVEVSAVSPEVAKKMKEDFGFVFDDAAPGQKKVMVKGQKSKLAVDAWLSSREGRMRQNNTELAKVMFQAIAGIAGTDLAQRIGPEQIVAMWNRGLHLAGIPEDAKWKIDPNATSVVEMKAMMEKIQELSKQMIQAASQQAKQVAKGVTQQAGASIAQQIMPELEKLAQGVQQAQAGLQAAAADAAHGNQVDEQMVGQLEKQKQQLDQMAAMVLRIDQFLKTATGGAPTPTALVVAPPMSMMPA